MRVIVNIQNELLLEFHQLYWLADLCAFWYFGVRLNGCADFLASRHLYVIHSWQKGEMIVYMTITDWQTEMPATPEQFAVDVGVAFENFKEVGATNLRICKTGENRVRTMTMWPDAETAEFAIKAITEVATSFSGITVADGEKGPLLAEYN